jgi:hypothetical protein
MVSGQAGAPDELFWPEKFIMILNKPKRYTPKQMLVNVFFRKDPFPLATHGVSLGS